MYKMKADGVVFYDPSSDDMALQVLSPKASWDLNKPGSMEFTLLPGNAVYDKLNKMKTVITLEQDDEIVFCGRVLETTTDLYNQKEVYCEGEMGFLLDTLQKPYKFEGHPADLFRQLLNEHNKQAEDFKRFEPGIVTMFDDDEETMTVEGDSYADTFSEIQSLLIDEYGGYLRVRRENGVRYLDYVSTFDQPCTQEINFGVNLVDIENKVSAQDIFTVFIPLGKMVNYEYTKISVANNDVEYLEDPEGIAKYGRIVRSFVWEEVTDPVELKKLGQEYLDKQKAETRLTITAIDLHACGVDVDTIHLGDTVHLCSQPHGLDKDEVCTAIELNIEKPEKSEYTFGMPQETLTDNNANTVAHLSHLINDQHKWITETDDALIIAVDTINLIGHRTTQLEIDVDAAEAAITMKASQDSVDILEEKHNEVVLRLDAAENAIKAKADLILLEGFLKVTDSAKIAQALSAQDIFCNSLSSNSTVWAETVNTGDLITSGLSVNGSDYTAHSHAVSVNADGTITLGEVATTGGTFKIADTAYYKNGVSAAYNEGYEGGKPVSVSRVATYNEETKSYDVTVVVKSADGSTNSFDLVSIDASAVYDAGYQACKDALWVSAAINSISNVAANTMYAQGYVAVFIGEDQVHYQSLSKSQYFSWMGQ